MRLGSAYFFLFTLFGVASPYLSVLVRGLGYSPLAVGVLLGLVEVSGIVGPLWLGRITDRMGRYRPALVLAIALILVSIGPLILVHNLWVSVLTLMIFAIGLRSLIPLLDAVATLSLGSTGNYGRVRSVGSASFVLMALFLQYTPWWKPETNPRIALWLVITASCTLGSFFLLKDQAPSSRRLKTASPVSPVSEPPKTWDSVFLLGLALIALGRLAMAPVNTFISLYAVEELHWDAVGLLWALAAGSEIPFMFISARLIRKFGPPRLLAVSGAALAVRLAIYALFPTRLGAVTGQLLHSFCFGLFHPAAVTFVATHVHPARRAQGMALYLSLASGLPAFIGSAAGGVLVQYFGYRVLFAAFIPFTLASSILIFAFRKTLEAPSRGQ